MAVAAEGTRRACLTSRVFGERIKNGEESSAPRVPGHVRFAPRARFRLGDAHETLAGLRATVEPSRRGSERACQRRCRPRGGTVLGGGVVEVGGDGGGGRGEGGPAYRGREERDGMKRTKKRPQQQLSRRDAPPETPLGCGRLVANHCRCHAPGCFWPPSIAHMPPARALPGRKNRNGDSIGRTHPSYDHGRSDRSSSDRNLMLYLS